jgi:hypothetical protein
MPEKAQEKREGARYTDCGYSTCGMTHQDCPNTWKGACELSGPHDGPHLCSSCKSTF